MKKEELENQKLQSEIDKNKAEEEKAKKEAVEVGKRTKFRWANYIIAGVIGAAAIYSWVHSTFSDLTKERNEKIREILLEIEKIVSDYAEKEGYEIILNDRVLIYGNQNKNLTENILAILNQ